jgi:hypothetical protein
VSILDSDEPLTFERLKAIMDSLRTWEITRSRFVERGKIIIMDIDDRGVPYNFRDWTVKEQLEYARVIGLRVIMNTEDYNEAMAILAKEQSNGDAVERLENEGGPSL